mmetsp:Transcript_42931/g.135482  ORF Transcript_42931/g.135482 Transcript_42931/m.135482 type:complete len:85 (+) Transcript_42931:3301-3555(+)
MRRLRRARRTRRWMVVFASRLKRSRGKRARQRGGQKGLRVTIFALVGPLVLKQRNFENRRHGRRLRITDNEGNRDFVLSLSLGL